MIASWPRQVTEKRHDLGLFWIKMEGKGWRIRLEEDQAGRMSDRVYKADQKVMTAT